MAANEKLFAAKLANLTKGKQQAKSSNLLTQHRFEWVKEHHALNKSRRELELDLNRELLKLKASDAFEAQDRFQLTECLNDKGDMDHAYPDFCRAVADPVRRLRLAISKQLLSPDDLSDLFAELKENAQITWTELATEVRASQRGRGLAGSLVPQLRVLFCLFTFFCMCASVCVYICV